MNSSSCEYIIKQKTEGKALAKKIGFIAIYVIVFLVLASATLLFLPSNTYFIAFSVIIALTAFGIFVSWRFTCVEYEIVISGGELTVTLLYGKSISKRILSRTISSFSEIGEYDERAYEEISKLSLQKDHVCISSLSAPDVFYAIYDDEKDRCILYFDVTEEAKALLRKLNPSAFRASAKRMNDIK